MIRNLQTLNFSYLFNYTIAGEDLQKLRLATQMLAEYDVAKVAQYLLMDEAELNAQAIETELQKRETIYNDVVDWKRESMDSGIRYTDKILVRTMIADGKTNAEIVKYAKVTELYIEKIRLKEFYIFSYDVPHDMVRAGRARWQTIEEEQDLNHANAFDQIRWLEHVSLENISQDDVERIIRKSPYFEGERVYFTEYIITKELYNELLACEEAAKTKKAADELMEEIAYCEDMIAEHKKHKLHHEKDVPALRKQYNDLNNEGGEGYIPHFYTFEALAYFEKKLAALKKLKNDLKQ